MTRIILALFVFLLLSSSSAEAWWSVPTNLDGSTHHSLTDDARGMLDGSNYPDVAIKFGGDISDWTSGKTDDARAHNSGSETLDKLNTLLNDGPIREWWDKAQNIYEEDHNFNSGDWSAYYYIALMMHLIEDQAVPAHAYNIKHGTPDYMDNLEQLASNNYQTNTFGITEAASPVSNYDHLHILTRERTSYLDPDSYWKAYWQYGTTCSGIVGYDSVYGGPPDYSVEALAAGYYGCPTDVFPAFWSQAGVNEINLMKDQLGQAVSHTAGALMVVSESLPPLVTDLDINPSADAVPTINTVAGTHIIFRVQENRTQNVRIFITLDSLTGEAIISPEYGTGKLETLSAGLWAGTLPWDETFIIPWDGRLASGAYASNGEHTLYVRVQDDDGNFSPEITHPFAIHSLVLESGYADPPSGNTNTDFYYYVYYKDPSGNSPTSASVYIDGSPHAMTVYDGGTGSDDSYIFGPIKLSAVSHTFFFKFTDRQGGTVYLPCSGNAPGPVVNAINQTYTLTVSKTGAGSGTVTGTGINCGTDCQQPFAAGTLVTLTSAAATDSSFGGWSDECTATSPTTCTLTLNADLTVTANFGRKGMLTWAQYFPDFNLDSVNAVRQTSDGGYVVLSRVMNEGGKGVVLKLFQDGSIDWQKSYANSSYRFDSSTAISPAQNGGYIFTGSDSNTSDGLLLMINNRGDVIEWQRSYEARYNNDTFYSFPNYFKSIQQTSDGGYVVAGSLRGVSGYEYASLLLKLDSNRNVQGSSQLSYLDPNYGYKMIHGQINDIQPASNGGFVATGWIQPPNTDYYYLLVLRLDAIGNVISKNSYGVSNNDLVGEAVLPTSDGGYVVTGQMGWASADALAIKFKADGSIAWFNTYADNSGSSWGWVAWAFSAEETTDGYLLTGSTNGSPLNYSWLIKVDKSYGQILSQHSLGQAILAEDHPISIKHTADGGFIAAAFGIGTNGNDSGAWVFKLDNNGDIDNQCAAIGTSNLTAIGRQVSSTYSAMVQTSLRDGGWNYYISEANGSAYVTPSNLTSNTVCSAASSNVAVSQTQLDFGSVSVGNSAGYAVYLSNNGSTAVAIQSISISGLNASEFTQTGNCTSIAPASSCTIAVTFRPSSLGPKTATLNISTYGPEIPVQYVALSGRGGQKLNIATSGSGSGTVISSPAGINCGVDCSETYNTGSLITLTVQPSQNSVFAGWSGPSCSGTHDCTVTMNADATVTAAFNLSPPVADFSATITSGTFPLKVSFSDLSSGGPTSWSWNFGDGSTSTDQNPTHEYMSAGEYSVTLTVTNALGSIQSSTENKANYISVKNYTTYAITATAGPGGAISPSGRVMAIAGSSKPFTIVPAPGHHIADVIVDGVSAGALPSVTFERIWSEHSVEALFAPTIYTISATAGSNGSISPAGTLNYSYGASQTYGITPNTGYYISDVRVDGKSVGAVSTYLFNNISASHTITASFSNAAAHTITASVGVGSGSISPSGQVSVNNGAEKVFSVTPSAGYHITDVLVDGAKVSTAATYTFSNVTADHTIEARFSNTYTLSVIKSGGTGTVTSNISGIECGNTCVASYTQGTIVTLTAMPGQYTTFNTWSGACTGTSTTCSVSMDTDRTVSVQFNGVGWSYAYNGRTTYSDSYLLDINETSDRGLIGFGYYYDFYPAPNSSQYGTWLVKLDSDGRVQWQKVYQDFIPRKGKRTADGGYVMLLMPVSAAIGGLDVIVMKVTASGEVQWTYSYGESNVDEWAADIQQTSDGSYIVVSQQNNQVAIFRLSSSGGLLWEKKYSNNDMMDWNLSVEQTSNGGFVVAGTSISISSASSTAFVLNLDSNGNIIWQKSYGGEVITHAGSIQKTADNGYVISGSAFIRSTSTTVSWILKLDANGNIVWQKGFDLGFGGYLKTAKQTLDEGYVLLGQNFYNGLVLKLDKDGNYLWQNVYDVSSPNSISAIQPTSDGGYIGAGQFSSSALVMRLDSVGKCNGDCFIISSLTATAVSTNASMALTSFSASTASATRTQLDSSVLDTNALSVSLCPPSPQRIDVNPTAVNFGSVELGVALNLSARVKNTGIAHLVIDSIRINGNNAGEFTQTNNCSIVLPDSACTINVTFFSVSLGLKSATLTIASNDPDKPIFTIPLSARVGQLLTVTTSGDGSGIVSSNPQGVACSVDCTAGFTLGTAVTLTATPAADSLFAGWSGGGCSGKGTCTVPLNVDTTVNAKFVLGSCSTPPVRIAGVVPAYYSSLQSAYDAASNGAVIQTLATNFTGTFMANRDISVTLEGGYWCGYEEIRGTSTLQGSMTTSAGAITIGNFELVTGAPDNLYTIVSTASSGGSISPAGMVALVSGANYSFTMTPYPGYRLIDVLIDGGSVGATNSYTFNNIATNHTIKAVFSTAGVASMLAPTSGSILAGASQAFTWTNAGASQYQVWAGSTVGGYEYGSSGLVIGNTATLTALPTNGSTVYVRLWSLNDATWTFNDYTYTAAGATMVSPANGMILTGTSQAFTWTSGNASQYQVWAGSTVGGYDYGSSGIVTGTTTFTLTALPTNGSTVYVRLWSLLGGTWYSNDYTYTAGSVAGTANMISPVNRAIFAGASQDFTWTNAGASLYQIHIGTTPGGTDIGFFPPAGTTATSTTVTGLPLTGATLYVRLWSLNGTAWTFNDYIYTASSTAGTATMITPPIATTLTGANQAFTWNNSGASMYQVWAGSTVGGYEYGSSGLVTGTTFTLTALPTNGNTVYVRLWSLVGAMWEFNDYTYTAASAASMVSPANGATLTGTSQTFTWTNTGASLYQIYVGTTPGASDMGMFPPAGTTDTTTTVTGLPLTGATLYVRLWSLNGTTWTFNDYVYTAGTIPNREVIWSDTANGTNLSWTINGTTLVATTPLPTSPVGWNFVGIADYNNDGIRDIVLSNTATGQNVVWLMNGNTITAVTDLPTAPVGWTVVATGDFTGDGHHDIIMTNAGVNTIWHLNAATLALDAVQSLQSVPAGWTIGAVADFNGDGKSDIVLRNPTTGQNAVWYMNGPLIASTGTLPVFAGTTLQIVAAGAINGDAFKDIMFRDTATGANMVWFLDGALNVIGTGTLPTVPTNWRTGGLD